MYIMYICTCTYVYVHIHICIYVYVYIKNNMYFSLFLSFFFLLRILYYKFSTIDFSPLGLECLFSISCVWDVLSFLDLWTYCFYQI